MAKDKEKLKRIKRVQKEARKINKEQKVVERVRSYDECLDDVRGKDLSREDWLFQEKETRRGITYIFNHFKEKDVFFFEMKYIEAAQALIKRCERLYSSYIRQNELLKEEAIITIVNYFRSSFDISKSGEISKLPLELRLYIYIEMLKRETSKYHIAMVLDRIAITLYKMNAYKEYDAANYILSWAQWNLFNTTQQIREYEAFHYSKVRNIKDNKFTFLLELNRASVSSVNVQRNIRLSNIKIVDSNVLRLERIDQEFWYGVECFLDKNIKNYELDKMALYLFALYYKETVPFVIDLEQAIYEYYISNDRSAVNKIIEKNRWKLIKAIEYGTCEKETDYTSKYAYVEHLFLFDRKEDITTQKNILLNVIPNEIDEIEYKKYILEMYHAIDECKVISKKKLEKYLNDIISSILNSTGWEPQVQSLIVHNLRLMCAYIWQEKSICRFREYISCFFKRLLETDEIKNAESLGEGNTVMAIYADDGLLLLRSKYSTKNHVVCSRVVENSIAYNKKRVNSLEINVEDIVNSDSYIMDIWNQNNTIHGCGLFELTLSEDERNRRIVNSKRLGIVEEYTWNLRNKDIENEIFKLNSDFEKHYDNRRIVMDVYPNNEFEKDMMPGVLDYRRRLYIDAAKKFLELIDKYPMEGRLYYYIAETFSYLFNGEEYSLRFFEKALEYCDLLEIRVDYGNILRHLRRIDEAIEVLENARAEYKNYGNPSRILCEIYVDKERRKIHRSEMVRKDSIRFNRIIREWETDSQILKPIEQPYI